MNATTSAGHGRVSSAAAAIIVAGALVFASGAQATAPIYKCLDAQLGLIYTDQRCKGGEQVDIHPGDADPAAVARLARAGDDIERRAAARLAEERRAAAQREAADFSRREREAALASNVAAYDSDAQTWYPAYLPMRPARPRAHAHVSHTVMSHGSVPHRPLTGPRS